MVVVGERGMNRRVAARSDVRTVPVLSHCKIEVWAASWRDVYQSTFIVVPSRETSKQNFLNSGFTPFRDN